MSQADHHHDHEDRRHRFRPSVVAISVICALALSAVMLTAMFFIAGSENVDLREQAEVARNQLLELRAKEQKALQEYSWIDKGKGTVQIPIERAMELLIDEPGVFPEPAPAAPTPQPTGAQP